MLIIRKHADFVKIRKNGVSVKTSGIVVQASPNKDKIGRVGFTASKKTVGNAVKRNLAKRRMRELARELIKRNYLDQTLDYIFIARHSLTKRDFAALRKDALYAMHELKRVMI